MNENELDQRLQAYLELCKHTYERMLREGRWPWESEDSQIADDLVESEDNP